MSIFYSAITYAISVVGALAGCLLVHRLTDSAIWGVFPESYRVRELSIYFVNALPVFMASFIILATLERVAFKVRRLGFPRLLILGLLAVPLSVAVNASLFPWSAPSTVMLTVFAILFVSIYAVFCHLVSLVTVQYRSFPHAPAVRQPLIAIVSVAALFVVGLGGMSKVGVINEQETFRPPPWPTPAEYIYTPAAAGLPGPQIDLLALEELPPSTFGGRQFQFVRVLDLDQDGFTDVAFKDSNGRISTVRNRNGVLEFDEELSRNIDTREVGNFSFADFNSDGMLDVIFDQPNLPAPIGLGSVAQGSVYWNFSPHKGAFGHLKLGVAEGPWTDVTDRIFPGGTPTVALKSEPILVFDANGDGLLDFMWAGYPRPRDTMQKLYIQSSDGSFTDRIDDLLDHLPPGIYPEGSDVGDIDGDGDIDFFGYGFLYLNDGGRYRQVCGDAMPGFFCDAVTRNEEGASFVDMDSDGKLDVVMSYHGAGNGIPKYNLQFFRGGQGNNGIPVRDPRFGNAFYGAHYYLRAKDFDFNGKREIIVWNESRIITLHGATWVDLLPAIAGGLKGLTPISWIDIDEDGDWDVLATINFGKRNFLLRNGLDPKRYVKISALGPGGVKNQPGATFRITLPGGRKLTESYRPDGGYIGVTDPRIVFPLEPDFVYQMNVCFPSLKTVPKTPASPPDVHFEVTGSKGNCVDYEFSVSDQVERLDLSVVASREGARFSTSPSRKQ